MIKKILQLLFFVLSPFASLLFLTPITMIPAVMVGKIVTANECGNAVGESLCGLGTIALIVFGLNAIVGVIVVILLHLEMNKTFSYNKKVASSLVLFTYFLIVAAAFLYFVEIDIYT